MKKVLYIFFVLFISQQISAQIGINTDNPDVSSVLDINSVTSGDKGMLIPRMTTAQKTAIVNPEHSLLVYDNDKNCISQNIGSKSSPQWTCLTLFSNHFFYMPSINIPTETLGNANINLYQIYKDQFASPGYKSIGAPPDIPFISSATDLYYYVTYHNPTCITINSINTNGVMNYTILKKANNDDYINIVFVVK